jgi:peptide deformylase
MAGEVRNLVYYPDDRLATQCPALAAVTDAERKEFDDLEATMMHHDGAGLASVQIGIMKQMYVVNHDLLTSKYKPGGAMLGRSLFIANPEFLEFSEELEEDEEGCLSIPGVVCKIIRPAKVKLKYLDYEGNSQVIEADSRLARCLQHEYDHVIGKVTLDYQSPIKRAMLAKKSAKFLKQQRNSY